MTFEWFDQAVNKRSSRNDFMSHGAYVFLLTMVTMLVVGLFGGTTWWVGTIGGFVGLISTLFREAWDEVASGSLEPLDIIGGTIAVVLAEAILFTLTGGA